MSGRAWAAVALLVCSLAAPAAPATATTRWATAQSGSEQIDSYDVELTVEATGALLVKETIAYDFGSTSHHGILREIPVRFDYDSRYERIYPLSVVSVHASAGTPAKYTVETLGRNKRIRIGDPKKTITGAHTYVITYRVKGALNGFEDHDELYWNAIGTDWDVPIRRGGAQVTAPSTISDIACFAGPYRSNLPCRESSHAGSSATFSQGSMSSFSGLTVVVAFAKGAVPEPLPILDERWSPGRAFAATPASVGGMIGLFVLILGGWGALAWKVGRDRRFAGSAVDAAFGSDTGEEERVRLFDRSETPVEFVPPDGIRPGQIGTLIDEVANPLDVTATIVDLAVRGYLKITEIPKHGWFGKPDWTLTQLKEADDDLLAFERTLLEGLFRSHREVTLSSLKRTFSSRLKKVQDQLYDDLVGNGWYATRPDVSRTKWYVLSIVFLCVAVIGFFLLAALTHLGLLGIPLIVGGIVFVISAKRMPRRTAKGTAVLRRVLGFRRFIDESEKERARFAEQQHLFSEYLPYAVVFGATEKWAKAFAGLDGQLPSTPWYVSTSPFTMTSFSHSMEGFTVTTAGTITSTPASSGSSGFGGGGFSGGGGGGGGGGSW